METHLACASHTFPKPPCMHPEHLPLLHVIYPPSCWSWLEQYEMHPGLYPLPVSTFTS